MFADPYEYEETTIITQVGDTNFKATGKVPTKQGWQALFDETKTEQQEVATLPLVHQGDHVQANLQTPQKETTPPVPFTEGTLITAMKTAGKTLDDEVAQAILKDVQGIGTSATRANVLEVLKKRGYLVTEKNKLHVSEAGITLCKAVELEPLIKYMFSSDQKFTAKSITGMNKVGFLAGFWLALILILWQVNQMISPWK